MDSCKDCKFYHTYDSFIYCRRYPTHQLTSAGNWCGEYLARDIPQEKPEEKPVVAQLEPLPQTKRYPGKKR